MQVRVQRAGRASLLCGAVLTLAATAAAAQAGGAAQAGPVGTDIEAAASAADASAAALMECGVTYLIDEWNLRRKPAIVLVYCVTGALGVLACVSIGDWSRIEPFRRGLELLFGGHLLGNWFDTIDTQVPE